MAAEIKLGQDVTWGTSAAGTLTCGKIISCDVKNTAKAFEQTDEDDELYSLILHDQRKQINVEVLAKNAQSVPEPGDLVTVGGVTDAIVLESSEKWAVGTTKKFAMTLVKSTA